MREPPELEVLHDPQRRTAEAHGAAAATPGD